MRPATSLAGASALLLGLLAVPVRPFLTPPQRFTVRMRVSQMEMSASSSAAAALPSALTASKPPPQLVELVEPETGTRVIIVGTMHYNPTSISMVENILSDLASRDALGSVIVESCEVRWNATKEILATPQGKLLKSVLSSEMKAASDVAKSFGRPVVLGDQRIDLTGKSLGGALKRTLSDLATPFGGGWQRFYEDLSAAAGVALPSGPGYLTPASFFDPRLLIAAPVSFMKYPLSFLARNPLSTSLVFAALFGLSTLDGQSAVQFAEASLEEQIQSVLASLAFAGLEFALFGRLLIEVLLAERNEIIARNILQQCRIYSKEDGTGGKGMGNDFLGGLSSWFAGGNWPKAGADDDDGDGDGGAERPVYSYNPESSSSAVRLGRKGQERVVVAVLGMAHCNGITKLLKEKLVQ